MSGLLLMSLAMVNVPVYLLLGRRLFGTWQRFTESLRQWLDPELTSASGASATEEVTTDVRLGVLLAGSAAAVLAEFFILAEFVFHLPM